jgi:hypothetical protein
VIPDQTHAESRLFLPNPRQGKISREWGRLAARNALCMQGGTVRVRYTPAGRQGQSHKPVNIGSIPRFFDRLPCGSMNLS